MRNSISLNYRAIAFSKKDLLNCKKKYKNSWSSNSSNGYLDFGNKDKKYKFLGKKLSIRSQFI